MALTKFIPSRSVLSGGLAGLAAWGMVMLAAHYGVTIDGQPIPYETAYLVATTIGGIVTNFVPDSIADHARALNVKVEEIAAVLPTATPTYPTGKNGENADLIRSIQGWKQ